MLKANSTIKIIYTEDVSSMIELYELRQFVAFASEGTLSLAAEKLHLSQPALSRNMKKLEDDLGITLFERGKNKLALNENGKYVYELAKKLIEDADSLALKAREFDRRSRTITLGVCAPAPVWKLAPLISNLYPHMALQTELDDEERLLNDLDNNIYQLAVTHIMPEDDRYYYKKCETEQLMFALPKGHRFARRKSLTFADMNGENMLVFNDIGFWHAVHTDNMPDSRFLTQSDRFSFTELVQTSSLPCFITDLSQKHFDSPASRVFVPISDEAAKVTYYLMCKPERKKQFAELFAAL